MADVLYKQKILILDFGSQYTQLIARRVREAKVYCEIQRGLFYREDLPAYTIRKLPRQTGEYSDWEYPYWGYATACSF